MTDWEKDFRKFLNENCEILQPGDCMGIEEYVKKLLFVQLGQKHEEWIPLKTGKLPDIGIPVIVTHSQGTARATWDGRFWRVIGRRDRFLKTVTAWQPWPEPYREDDT